MTYPYQDGRGRVAGGTSRAPCPTPIAPFARVCTSSRTSQGCYNPVKTMTSPMSSSGSPYPRDHWESPTPLSYAACASHLGSRLVGASCAVRCPLGLPIGGPTISSAVRPSGLPRALETYAATRTLRPLGCWQTAKDGHAPNTETPRRACAMPWTMPRGGRPCAIGGNASSRSPQSTTTSTPHVAPRRTTATFVPCKRKYVCRHKCSWWCANKRDFQAVAYQASACAKSSKLSRTACVRACIIACLACSKKGPACISRDSRGGEVGAGADGGCFIHPYL